MDHGKQTGRNIHSIVAFTYADAAARTAAVSSDFTAADLDKVAKQLDDGTKWTLDAITPVVVWTALGAGGAPAVTNGQLVVRVALTHGLSQASVTQLPINAVVHSCAVNITAPFDAGTTLTVGRAGSLSLLQAAVDNDATIIGIYEAPQDTDWGGAALPVVVTLANGGPITTGSGFCAVSYSIPAV